jgi:hypothetical protein
MYPLVWLDDIIMTSPALLNDVDRHHLIASNLASSLSQSSNDSISSFYWTRGSKLCFLTNFSYFSCYYFILEFLHSCYLLISLRLSWLHRNPISHPIFSNRGNSQVVSRMCTPMFLAHIVLVSLEQDVCGTLVVASVLVLLSISALRQRFLVQMSVG